MRLVAINSSIVYSTIDDHRDTIDKDRLYVMPDILVSELANVYGKGIINKDTNFEEVYKKYDGSSLDNKSLFCFRSGGIGDLMFMLVGIQNVKEKYPTCKIISGSTRVNSFIFKASPFVDDIIFTPYPYDLIEDIDYHLYFEGIIEGNPLAEQINAYDLFLQYFNLDYNKISGKKKIPVMNISAVERKYIEEIFVRLDININEDIIVGIQVKTSSPIRNYSLDLTNKLILLLAKRNIKVILLGSSTDGFDLTSKMKNIDCENVFDFTKYSTSIDRFMSIVNFCDIVIGADSSALHLAGAFGKYILGLFGAFDSDMRLKYYNNAIALQGVTNCSPCYLHGNIPCRNSLKDGSSACMNLIKPELIEKALIDKLLPLVKKG